MRNEKYEPIEFNSWQELAKYVIDGGKIYFTALDHTYVEVCFSGAGFNCDIERVFANRNSYIKKQPTIEELVAIKPRLCWVWDDEKDKPKEIALIKGVTESGSYESVGWLRWGNAQMLTDDEIKQFLDKEPS